MNCILKIVFTFVALLFGLFLNAKEVELIKPHSNAHNSEILHVLTEVVDSKIHCVRDATSSHDLIDHQSSEDIIDLIDKIDETVAKGGVKIPKLGEKLNSSDYSKRAWVNMVRSCVLQRK